MSENEIRAFLDENEKLSSNELVTALVQTNKLTEYQAQLISQGNSAELLICDYLILGAIGAGGMGQVYLAEHRHMGRRVALKTLPAAVAKDQPTVQRFRREVRAVAKLDHPNIVTAYDAGEEDGQFFFVMECIDGIDLSKLINHYGPLSVDQTLCIVWQVAHGLAYAHGEGVIHRDIKPANVLLDKKCIVKILDLGLARVGVGEEEASVEGLTRSGMLMGTVEFMPPEQANDSRAADARSDVYSLGCLFYFLLTGKPIYSATTLVQQILAHRDHPIPSLAASREDVSPQVDAVFQKMVAKDPHARQQTMTEVLTELEEIGVNAGSTSMTDPGTFPVDQDFETIIHSESPVTDVLAHQAAPTEASATPLAETAAATINGGTPNQRTWFWRRATIVWLIALLAGGAAMFGLTDLMRIQTAAGTIVIVTDQPELKGAIVSVDGKQKVTIKDGVGEQTLEITPDAKRHELEVAIAGFKTFTKEFTFETGSKQTIKVTLEPLEAPVATVANDPHRYVSEIIVRNSGGVQLGTTEGFSGGLNVERGRRTAITQISIASATLSEKEWNALAEIPSLDRFVCRGTPVPFEFLSGMTTVRELQVSTGGLSGENAAALAALQELRDATFYSNTGLYDQACIDIAKLKELRQLDLYNTGITGEGLDRLAKLRHLRSLTIGGRGLIEASDLARLQEYPSLISLHLFWSRLIDDKLVAQLSKLTSLRMLRISCLTEHEGEVPALLQLQEALPNCVVIYDTLAPDAGEVRAVEWALKYDGVVGSHSELASIVALPDSAFAVKNISVDGGLAEVKGAEALEGVHALEHLTWFRMADPKAELRVLRHLPTLRSLTLSYSMIRSQDEIAEIANAKQLESLALKRCPGLEDAMLEFLSEMQSLWFLDLAQNAITDDAVEHLSKSRGLRALVLSACDGVTNKCAAKLANLTQLRYLQLDGTSIDDGAVAELGKLKSLRTLHIGDTAITAAGAEKLQAILPQCVVFHESLDGVPWSLASP